MSETECHDRHKHRQLFLRFAWKSSLLCFNITLEEILSYLGKEILWNVQDSEISDITGNV